MQQHLFQQHLDLFPTEIINFNSQYFTQNDYWKKLPLLSEEYLNTFQTFNQQYFQPQLYNTYFPPFLQNPFYLDTVKSEFLLKKEESFDSSSNIGLNRMMSDSSILNLEQEGFTILTSPKTEVKEENHKITVNEYLKNQIQKMLVFIITKLGKISEEEISWERRNYFCDRNLLELFDMLIDKYVSAKKCREDMVRFVLRNVLSYLRDNVRHQRRLSLKAASMVLCRKYYKFKSDEKIKESIDIKNEKELLSFLLPYKKNSRNKTANSCFISEIFASEDFRHDYSKYLEQIDKILEIDNDKKIEQFTDFLIECLSIRGIDKIKGYKRLPWLQSWLEATKVIANELPSAHTWKNFNKRPTSVPTKKQNKIKPDSKKKIKTS